tara:strand:- start:613 stop:1041 length:429 start_codon:yes stop_codon:yes gene_type:complete
MSNPNPVDVHVGKRLRLKRTILGMSQEAIGNAIGVTFQQIQKYERGINRIGASRLYDFSKVLHVPVSYFFEEFDNSGADGNEAFEGMAEEAVMGFEHEQIASRETMEMMRAYYRIGDTNVRKRIFELIKAVADNSDADSDSK